MRNLLFAAMTLWISPALACSPCPASLDLDQTLAKASLIIVGERMTEMEERERKGPGGPEMIEIAVHNVLKGNYTEGTLEAEGWSGMCPYGMVTPKGKHYIMFFDKRDNESFYRPVNSGCAVKVLDVETGGTVKLDPPVTVEEFKKRLP